MEKYGDAATPLMYINENNRMHVLLSSDETIPRAGSKLVSLVEAEMLDSEKVVKPAKD